MDHVETKVKGIIGDITKVDPSEVTDETAASDLGADSLDLIEIVMGIEREFGISIDDADIEKMSSVRDLVAHVRTKL